MVVPRCQYRRAGSLRHLVTSTLRLHLPSTISEPARGRSLVAPMTEPVLQSFCERCGTRYTSADPEAKPPEEPKGKLGLFGRRSPRGDEEATTTVATSSEAFASTFHFCLECRQYVCTDCWSEESASCLTCRASGPAEGSLLGATGGSSGHRSEGPRGAASAKGEPTGGSEARPFGGAPVELDEWGRPRKPARTTGNPASEKPATIFGQADREVDPWRGVVFSADEADTADDEGATAPPPPSDLSSRLAARAAAAAWPDSDRPAEPPVSAPQRVEGWPGVDAPRQSKGAGEPTPARAELEPMVEPMPEPIVEPEPVAENRARART